MKPEKIQKLLSLGEGPRVEFKTHLRATDAIGREVCGFLNARGGFVVCGISDKGDVIGIEISDGQLADFERRLHDHVSPKSLISIQRQSLADKQVIVIEVPKGQDTPYSYRNVIYLRVGERSKPADAATVRDMVLSAAIEPERWERRFSLADIETELDANEITMAIKDAEKVKRAFFKDSSDPVRTLEDFSVARYGRLTNGGDVLFTRNPAVRLPQIRIRAMRYNSDKAGDILP